MKTGKMKNAGQSLAGEGSGTPTTNPHSTHEGVFVRGRCSPVDRFVDDGSGTVTDRCTDFKLQKDKALGRYNWQDALKYCASLELGGHSDWPDTTPWVSAHQGHHAVG